MEKTMPWKEVTKMSSRMEFIKFFESGNEKFNHLCKRFGISRKTGYLLVARYRTQGVDGLQDISRRPFHSPFKTSKELEEKILRLRINKRCWGGRKIRAWFINNNEKNIPSASTITDILRRAGLIEKQESTNSAPGRFEHDAPNELWQCDFKGHFPLRMGRCHPLTILDDHSRYSICLQACANEQKDTVKQRFINVFKEYGLPWRMNFDNGSPWGVTGKVGVTELYVWLVRLGIRVSYSRIRHPQTNGKDERFHRSLKAELLRYNNYHDLIDAQKSFDEWRINYNFERPHEAVLMKPPASRYKVSTRSYSDILLPIEYRDTDIIRNVNKAGQISFKGKKYFVGEALYKLPIGIREEQDESLAAYFCHQKLFILDLTKA